MDPFYAAIVQLGTAAYFLNEASSMDAREIHRSMWNTTRHRQASTWARHELS